MARLEGEKPYAVNITANDAYELDMLQHSYSQSEDPRHQQLAKSMDKFFREESPRRQEMAPGEEYSVRG